jgi:hypothetical protein
MKNYKKGAGGIVALVLVIVVIIVGVLLYRNSRTSEVVESTQSENSQVQTSDTSSTNFNYKIGDRYVDTKVALAANGWMTYIPNNPNEPWKSAGDQEFPEIGWCGTGVDRICSVNFKKDTQVRHLNVQIKYLRQDELQGFAEWVVVGSE